jgi:NADPH:quinone reductase-like Zn-dependent oxidoreductase
MRAWTLPPGCKSIDDLRQVERPEPRPGPGEVVVRVRAASLNYRDQAVVAGTYFGGTVMRELVPLSDGAGEVVAVGSGVTRVREGDRVATTFFQHPPGVSAPAPPAPLGSPLDGVLVEQVALREDGVVSVPDGYSFEQAACLPCAGVTAWHALFRAGVPVRAGETVLVLGSGGVSIFALQLARAAGARVIATSSSDAKIERLKTLGAWGAINYARTPEWGQEVLRLTAGRGVDCVIEVGGAGTLARSLQSLGRGGKVCLIGFLAGREGDSSPYPLMMKAGNMHGIFVGDRDMFEELTCAIEANAIEPVIDRVFPFDQAVEAYRHQASGAFVGKVVIRV